MDFCHSYTQAQGTSVVGTQWEQFQQAFALLASPPATVSFISSKGHTSPLASKATKIS